MSKWDKMDRKVWLESEVMQELEKKVVGSALEMGGIIKENNLNEGLKNTETSAVNTAKALGEVERAAKNLGYADDQPEDLDEETMEYASKKLSDVLKMLADTLIDEDGGNNSLVYKLEKFMRWMKDNSYDEEIEESEDNENKEEE